MGRAGVGAPVLQGLRVLDVCHHYSGAFAASMLGDLGADVLAIEHPKGSPIRTMLPKKDGQSVWWKVVQRNKRVITLDISKPEGQQVFRKLVASYDVLIENFRPGTMEKWGLGPKDLAEVNGRLTMVRISGFGQSGPYSARRGYGTVAEALSGFAHLNGFPDRPPALPSVTLADGVTAIFAVVGALVAVRAQEHADPDDPPRVEVVDAALLDSLIRIIPSQTTVLQQLGVVMSRPGNSLIEKGVLRDMYKSRDGRYFVIGGGIGERSMANTLAGVGGEHLRARVLGGILKEDDSVVKPFLKECNEFIHTWAAELDWAEIEPRLRSVDVVFSPIYDASDIVEDPHVLERGSLLNVKDEDWGEVLQPAPVPRFPDHDHTPRHTGRPAAADNEATFLQELGMTRDELDALREHGIV
jgi:crotonobetainyl-CoA:carnitine CoA-transferase CaiB-like acyl-CoA transferase